ncbi:INO80 complex subunit B-like [Acanthaster planci]|uniref:INO80 complex subunit B-like n=1 Tax=Acanthaster planci TaxID=133434 RepID=A0A8B7ZX26_ACAPL|nr:INO80 complex subunit B-like [Acanthaster planci]XP_022109652.1 INO80 complex subunit B-like [Acanthaster planci]XP_022109653.1 INO80 complex subunit B-like [Acanthaster planci]
MCPAVSMGKRRDVSQPSSQIDITEEDFAKESSSSAHKKHKKHKHKKHHKHKREHHDSSSPLHSPEPVLSSQPIMSDPSGKPQLKLKIKIGGQTLGTKSYDRVVSPRFSSEDEDDEDEDEDIEEAEDDDEDIEDIEDEQVDVVQDDEDEGERFTPWQDQTPPASNHGSPSENPDEEEAWLDALEAGQLDDYGEIKRVKDPSLLTARQRAMLHGMSAEEEKQLLQLPSGAKPAEMTVEMLEKKAEKAQKRRAQAHKKVEEHKKQTIARLLKKQDSKLKGIKAKSRREADKPRIRYVNNINRVTMSFPPGMQFPLDKQVAQPPKPVVLCGAAGCSNPKKYSCSKTGVPLCSLECYKKNLLVLPVTCAS